MTTELKHHYSQQHQQLVQHSVGLLADLLLELTEHSEDIPQQCFVFRRLHQQLFRCCCCCNLQLNECEMQGQ